MGEGFGSVVANWDLFMGVGFVTMVVSIDSCKRETQLELEPLGSESTYQLQLSLTLWLGKLRATSSSPPPFPYLYSIPVKETEFMAIMIQRNRGWSG